MKKIYIWILTMYFLFTAINFIPIPFIGSLLKPLAVFILFIFILNGKIHRKKTFAFIVFVIFTIITFLGFSSSINIDHSYIRLMSLLQLLLLLFIIESFYITLTDYNYVEKSLLWSSRLSVILILFFGFSNFTSYGRLFLDSGLFKEDPNFLTGYLFFGISYSLNSIFSKKNTRKFLSLLELIVYILTNNLKDLV